LVGGGVASNPPGGGGTPQGGKENLRRSHSSRLPTNQVSAHSFLALRHDSGDEIGEQKQVTPSLGRIGGSPILPRDGVTALLKSARGLDWSTLSPNLNLRCEILDNVGVILSQGAVMFFQIFFILIGFFLGNLGPTSERVFFVFPEKIYYWFHSIHSPQSSSVEKSFLFPNPGEITSDPDIFLKQIGGGEIGDSVTSPPRRLRHEATPPPGVTTSHLGGYETLETKSSQSLVPPATVTSSHAGRRSHGYSHHERDSVSAGSPLLETTSLRDSVTGGKEGPSSIFWGALFPKNTFKSNREGGDKGEQATEVKTPKEFNKKELGASTVLLQQGGENKIGKEGFFLVLFFEFLNFLIKSFHTRRLVLKRQNNFRENRQTNQKPAHTKAKSVSLETPGNFSKKEWGFESNEVSASDTKPETFLNSNKRDFNKATLGVKKKNDVGDSVTSPETLSPGGPRIEFLPTKDSLFDRISPFKQISLNLIQSVNATKIGFLLGIFVDAFKVGS